MSIDTTHFSIEFFPPRTPAGEEKLDAVHAELAALKPEFFFGHLRCRRFNA